jgi:transposase, IS5 family
VRRGDQRLGESDPASQAEAAQWLADWNGAIHGVCGRIEKILGTSKRSYGFRRMRCRGLSKTRLQTHLTAIFYNLKRTLNILTLA